MSVQALTLALGAAGAHSLWTILLARTTDKHAATAVALCASVVAFAPAAALAGSVSRSVWPFLAASVVLELVYFALLAGALDASEVSVMYPVVRGASPVMLAAAGALGLGGPVGPWVFVGAVLVGVGVVAVGSGGTLPSRWRETSVALAIGACVAAYTLVDRYGVEHAHPITYLWLVLAAVGPLYMASVVRVRGAAAVREQATAAVWVAGVAIFGAYALALAAMQLSSAAAVGATREASVLVVVAASAFVLGERVGVAKAAGAVAVVTGVALVAVS